MTTRARPFPCRRQASVHHPHVMSNYSTDDDDDFWDGPQVDPDRTSQLERVRGRSPERTRTHHVVRREQPLEELDDGASMWLEPALPIARRLGPLQSVDPRVLSVGAVVLAAVLAVPLFGALGGGDGDDALRAIDQQTTTTVATTEAPPSTAGDAVVVTAATDGEPSTDSNSADLGAEIADDEAAATDEADEVTAAPQALSAAPDCSNRYTAAAGDYWLRIADDTDTSLDDLLEVNEATAETPIYPGSTICLPAGAATPAGFSSASDDDSSGGGAATMAAEAQACGNRYESVAGDYWLRIADAADLALDELLKLNDATVDTPLYPGSEVYLPVGASGPSAPTTVAPTTAAPSTQAPTTTPATTDAPASTAPATTEPPATTQEQTTVPPAPPAPGEIEQIIREVWPDDLEEQALRIAWRESGYNPRAQNYCCSGLFQIYYDVHASWLADLGVTSADDLYDPRTNATAAYALYQRSGSWEPWRMTAD